VLSEPITPPTQGAYPTANATEPSPAAAVLITVDLA
jgi:hypothetical protein